MDLNNLKLFAEVAGHGSLTKAAIALGSAPSVLSRKIAAVERQCGGRLFHRTGRGLELTELGRRVLPRISDLLFDLDQFYEAMKGEQNTPHGEVRVGFLASLSPLIDRLFREVRSSYPDIRLNVFGGSSGQLDEWLMNSNIDMAVLFRYGKKEIGSEHVLGMVDTYLVGPPRDPITRKRTVDFSRLHQLPLILAAQPNGLRTILEELARKKKLTLSVVMEANSLAIQKDIVAGGGVHTVLAGYAAMREVKEGVLQASRILNPEIERTVTLGMARNKSASLGAREVAKLIGKIVAATPDATELRRPSRARNS